MCAGPVVSFHSRFLKADMRVVAASGTAEVASTLFPGMLQIDDLGLPGGRSCRLGAGVLGGCDFLLPVAGDVIAVIDGVEELLSPGFIYSIPGRDIVIRNPFDEETVNLLRIHTNVTIEGGLLQAYPIILDAKNRLTVAAECPLAVMAGVYDSRMKGRIGCPQAGSYSVSYVINGSFEIEERLAEYRDALLLWETPEIEFEALSEAAILLHFGSLYQ